jgi:hypothetical protein
LVQNSLEFDTTMPLSTRNLIPSRPLLQVIDDCLADLISGERPCRELIQELVAAVAQRKAVRGRCGRRGGRKPMPLPWDEIAELRRRRKTWDDIAERLEVAGFRISRSALSRRAKQRRAARNSTSW